MWSTVQSSPAEKAALFSLLDEYLSSSRPPTTTTATTQRSSTTTSNSISPSLTTSPRRSVPAPTPPSISPSPPTSSRPPTSFQTSLADSALQQPALSSAALRRAGVPAGAAGVAAQFGAKHHEALAPHVANAAQKGWQAQTSNGGGGGGGGPPARGPKVPSGLSSAGAKSFGRAITSLKAPMPKNDPSKAPFSESLATHTPVRTNHIPSPPHRAVASNGMGRARALYDYDGAESEDLAVREGDLVEVVEHVSEDWWKCRSSDGKEGIIPSAYLEKI